MMRKKIHDLEILMIVCGYSSDILDLWERFFLLCLHHFLSRFELQPITTPQQFPELHCKMAASPVDDKAALEKVVSELATSNDAW